ncbi:MAG: hypothetical protein QMB51_01790 [Patescibacteria group bacterium]
MIKKTGWVITMISIALFFTSCVSMGGSGVLFVQESHKEDWIKFYTLNTNVHNDSPSLISNVSLRGEIDKLAINPMDQDNRVYWINSENMIYRSYEDSLKSVSQEAFFKNFIAPSNANKIFIDWLFAEQRQENKWRENHFVYYIDSAGAIWAINTNTEAVERWNENITIPSYAKDVYILQNGEYPVMYVGKDNKPTRINARTGLEQVYVNVTINGTMILDEITGEIYELQDGNGLIRYDNVGNKRIVSTNILDYNVVSPTIINGVIYFGDKESETIKTNGKALL